MEGRRTGNGERVRTTRCTHKEQREKGVADLHQSYEAMRSRGWTVTETHLGDLICNTATPPAKESNDTPAITGCFSIAKRFAYSVAVQGPHFKTPPEKVKALGDSLARRLP